MHEGQDGVANIEVGAVRWFCAETGQSAVLSRQVRSGGVVGEDESFVIPSDRDEMQCQASGIIKI